MTRHFLCLALLAFVLFGPSISEAETIVIDFSGGTGEMGYISPWTNSFSSLGNFIPADGDGKYFSDVYQYTENGFVAVTQNDYWGIYRTQVGDFSNIYWVDSSSSMHIGSRTTFSFLDNRAFDLDSLAVKMNYNGGWIIAPDGASVIIPMNIDYYGQKTMTFSNDFKNITSFTIKTSGDNVIDDIIVTTPTATPEPGTMLLMGIGAAGAAFMRRRKMKSAN